MTGAEAGLLPEEGREGIVLALPQLGVEALAQHLYQERAGGFVETGALDTKHPEAIRDLTVWDQIPIKKNKRRFIRFLVQRFNLCNVLVIYIF